MLYWRDVPTDNATLGPSSLACEPKVMQLFVAPQKHDLSAQMLETELMILRRRCERVYEALSYSCTNADT